MNGDQRTIAYVAKSPSLDMININADAIHWVAVLIREFSEAVARGEIKITSGFDIEFSSEQSGKDLRITMTVYKDGYERWL